MAQVTPSDSSHMNSCRSTSMVVLPKVKCSLPTWSQGMTFCSMMEL